MRSSIATTRTLPAQAASLAVNTTTDELNSDGDCSLREAIQAVRTQATVDACPAGDGNDTISLPAGTYTLSRSGGDENDNSTGDLDISFGMSGGSLTIQGAGVTTTIIDGGGIDRALHLISSNGTLILHDLTVRNGQLSVLNSTISHNVRGGVIANSTTTLTNMILAENAVGGWGNCSGTITSQGHNLSSDNSCTASFTAPGDRNNTDPLLGPLQNNGGPTPTRALLSGSPAINAGTIVGCPATDQRGVPRPQGGTCDIGAFEMIFVYLYLPLVLR